MRQSLVAFLAAFILFCGSARAQFGRAGAGFRVQNFDASILVGFNSVPADSLAGGMQLSAATQGACCSGELGYQFARTEAGSFWVEYARVGCCGSSSTRWMDVSTLGVRWMAPITERFSIFGVAGGGAGVFHIPFVIDSTNGLQYLESTSVTHGSIDAGGGVDLRLSKRLSLRGEVRDYITGRGLSGISGVNHWITLAGVAFHF